MSLIHAVPGRMSNRYDFPFISSSPSCSSGVMSSMIQMLRPCVPTIRSCSRGWTMMSSMRTVGRPVVKRFHSFPPIERDVDRVFRAEEQEALVARILGDHVDVAIGQVARNRRPRFAEIARDEHVRLHVVGAMAVERHVTGPGVEMRRLDARDVRLLRHARHPIDDVLPRAAAVAADLQVAVVGAHPQDARHDGRLADRHDVAERGGAVVLRGHRRLAVNAHDGPIVAADVLRQVRRGHPRVATIVRSEQPIPAEIDGRGVVPRQHERRVPVEAICGVGRRRRDDVARRPIPDRTPNCASVSGSAPSPAGGACWPRDGPRGRILTVRPVFRSSRLVAPSCDSE